MRNERGVVRRESGMFFLWWFHCNHIHIEAYTRYIITVRDYLCINVALPVYLITYGNYWLISHVLLDIFYRTILFLATQ